MAASAAGALPPPGPEAGLASDAAGRERRPWRRVIIAGFLIILVFFGGAGLWAGLAPLGSGAIANGQLQVDTNRKTVQHLEGGIVRRILVRDGDLVQAGELLIELDDTLSRVEHDLLHRRFLVRLGARARLRAERDGGDTIAFPPELQRHRDEPDYAEVMDGQRRLFRNRRNALASQDGLLRRRIDQSGAEIRALEARQTADRKQLALIGEEIASVEDLVRRGLERRPRLLALRRAAADLEGGIANHAAMAARAEQAIAEIGFQRINLREQRASEVETALRQTENELITLKDQLRAARDRLARTRITAPRAGRVLGMRVHTEGGVIRPGEPILDLVPEQDDLIVQVQIDPTDIDVVRIGAAATVRLTSFSQRATAPIDGTLIDISADTVRPDGAPPFYLGRIRFDKASLDETPGLTLVQGMPATAVIGTTDQTLLEYLLAPLTRGLDLALRED